MLFFEKLIASYAQKENADIQAMISEYAELMPEQVEIQRNLPYETDSFAGRINVYQLKELADQHKPIIVNVHGGGMVCGMMEQNDLQCARFAQEGYLVFAIEYPLLPQADVFQIDRVLADGLNHIYHLCGQYHGDLGKVFWTGDSAGAYLITNMALLKEMEEMRELFGVPEILLPINALGLFSGMFYTNKKDKIGLTLSNLLFGKIYKKKSFFKYTQWETAEMVKALPPIYMQSSQEDMLKKHSLSFYKALEKEQHNVKFRFFEKDSRLVHAFAALYPEYPESKEVYKEMMDFFQSVVG